MRKLNDNINNALKLFSILFYSYKICELKKSKKYLILNPAGWSMELVCICWITLLIVELYGSKNLFNYFVNKYYSNIPECIFYNNILDIWNIW